MKNPVDNLIDTEVIVIASGVTYRGILKEIGEKEVSLMMETGWMTVPLTAINTIKKAEEESVPERTADIPPDFYNDK